MRSEATSQACTHRSCSALVRAGCQALHRANAGARTLHIAAGTSVTRCGHQAQLLSPHLDIPKLRAHVVLANCDSSNRGICGCACQACRCARQPALERLTCAFLEQQVPRACSRTFSEHSTAVKHTLQTTALHLGALNAQAMHACSTALWQGQHWSVA